MNRHLLAVLLGVTLLCAAAGAAMADEQSESLKRITNENAGCIVEINCVVKFTSGMQTQDQNMSGRGTVLDATGLILISKSNFDRGGKFNMGQMRVEAAIDPNSIKIQLTTGETVDAELVAEDPDFDLAFLQAKPAADKPVTFTPLNMSKTGTTALGEMVLTVLRQSKELDYAPLCLPSRINSDVTKPRAFWTAAGIQGLGTPIFNLQGELIGIATNYRLAEDGGMVAIVMPIADFTKALDQAKKQIAEAKEE